MARRRPPPPFIYYIRRDPAGGGGGGGAPAWVPANAEIHIDFVGGTPQGRAWVQGTGEVAVDTLLGNDPNADSAWAQTGYSSSDLVVDGCDPSLALGFIGSARSKILAGATMRFVVKNGLANQNYSMLVVTTADGSFGLDISVGSSGGLGFSSLDGPASGNAGIVINPALGAINGVACTLTPTRCEAAANGNASLATDVLTEEDFPPSVVAALMDCNTGVIVRSITLYDPLPDTTGLSELSQVS